MVKLSTQKSIEKENKIVFSFTLQPEIVKDLDLFAKDLNTSRSNALEVILVRFLPQLTNYDNVIRKAFKNAFTKARRDIIDAEKWRKQQHKLKEKKYKRLKKEIGDPK